MRIVSWVFAALALTAGLCAAGAARADGGIALDRFHPAPAGDRFLGVPSPYVAGGLDVHGMLLVDYAFKPLLLKAPPADLMAAVRHQAVVHADATLAIGERALVNVDVPVVSIQEGDADPRLHLADFGDVRLGGRARLAGDNGGPFQVGLGGYLWVPSATGAVAGDGKVRGMPYLSAGGLSGSLLWTIMTGAELRFQQLYRGLVQEGSSLDLGAGLAYLVDKERQIQIGAEATGSLVLAHPSSRNLNAELLFHGRYRFLDRFEAGAGVGPGLSVGVGTPAVRALVFFAYVPVADLKRRWEPTPIEEPASADALFSHATRLPNPDDPLAEPYRPAPPLDRATRGAPGVRLSGDEITADDGEILFEVGSAAVGPEAEWKLHAIADLLIAHPEIRRVELRGHADIHGTRGSNDQLGARRAEAVKRALIRHSVEPGRLVVKSYGPGAPAEPSTTPEGMRRNRRVEIWVVERAAPGR